MKITKEVVLKELICLSLCAFVYAYLIIMGFTTLTVSSVISWIIGIVIGFIFYEKYLSRDAIARRKAKKNL